MVIRNSAKCQRSPLIYATESFCLCGFVSCFDSPTIKGCQSALESLVRNGLGCSFTSWIWFQQIPRWDPGSLIAGMTIA